MMFVGSQLVSWWTDIIFLLDSALTPTLLALRDCCAGSTTYGKVVLTADTLPVFFGFPADGVSIARPLSQFSCPCMYLTASSKSPDRWCRLATSWHKNVALLMSFSLSLHSSAAA